MNFFHGEVKYPLYKILNGFRFLRALRQKRGLIKVPVLNND